MKIGVFDSGIGGLSIVNAIIAGIPDIEVDFKNDTKNLPYGTKTPDELFSLVRPIFQEFIDDGCKVIVIACNTVSTTLIERLRKTFTIPMVGVEPMIKPATSATHSKVITVCATPTTLKSERYTYLKDTYAKDIQVIEPDCSAWASLIESNQMNNQKIRDAIEPSLQMGSDVVVLGCTHYHWIEDRIRQIVAGRAVVIQPETAVVKQLNRVIEQLD